MYQSRKEKVLDITFGFWKSSVLFTAVELNLFSTLKRHPDNLKGLAEKLDVKNERGLEDILDVLVSLEFLDRVGEGYDCKYIVTKDSEILVNSDPQYIGSIVKHFSNMWADWGQLTKCIKTGAPAKNFSDISIPQEKGQYWKVVKRDTGRYEELVRAMESFNRNIFQTLASTFNFGKYETCCDLGGSTGSLSKFILENHPKVKCINFDLPDVLPLFEKMNNLHTTIHFIAGDFFVNDIPRSDVFIMSLVLHNWNLEKKKFLLQKAYDSLNEHGKLIVLEFFIDDERKKGTHSMLMSLNMAVEKGDAFDFSIKELKEWAFEIGYSHIELLTLVENTVACIISK